MRDAHAIYMGPVSNGDSTTWCAPAGVASLPLAAPGLPLRLPARSPTAPRSVGTDPAPAHRRAANPRATPPPHDLRGRADTAPPRDHRRGGGPRRAINSVAGGGTLLTFPALVGLGIPPLVANATSTVALWPAAVSSMWGYRGELAGSRRWVAAFAPPSLLGGLLGALLLLRTSNERFDALVPWLVLGATALFIGQRPVLAALRRRASASPAVDDQTRTSRFPPPAVLFYQGLVSIYGGYFGAGVGILMLGALGFMGLSNIHRMNGLKNWGGLCMNAIAAATFIVSGIVDWPVALAMAVGATVGGYTGSRLAQRTPQKYVRALIAAIGLVSGVWLLVR